MPEKQGQEKTEQATPKRLQEARDKGQVAKSIEINSFAIFTAGLIILFLSRGLIADKLRSISINIFSSLDSLEANKTALSILLLDLFVSFVTMLAPIMIGLFMIGLIANIAQVGWHISSQALTPKSAALNPISGLKSKIFSTRSLFEAFKSVLKLLIIGGITYIVLEKYIVESIGLVDFSIYNIMDYIVDSSFSLTWKVGLVFAAIAIIDIIYQRSKFKKDMMMTKQEVREENKQLEGDPLVKGYIRRQQLSMARRRMMQDVPKADVVITNPTHYAVALKYDMGGETAPKIVAKGMDYIALKIKEIAVANGVYIHEDKQLARTLYKTCEVGDEIPSELYKAVAQILAYVYQLKNGKKKISVI